ncbi:MAG: molecular chaperone DnaJ [Holosporales bacterium]|jgi:molecular chaperone DnaJ|nr:molecular chaperone DnaJ [Holosporales bacterium]
MSKEYYSALGLPKTATEQEIKKAYRKLAMEFHPDRHHGDKDAEKKFKEINEAYEVLKDPQKKAAYDRYGSAAFDGGGRATGGAGDPGGWGGNGGFDFGGFAGFNFEDVLGDMFGFGGGASKKRSAAARGGDVRVDVTISLEEAFCGKNITVRYHVPSKCAECDGTGTKDKKSTVCTACKGVGSTISHQGFISIERTCSMCHGSGAVIKNPCPCCNGAGRAYSDKTLDVAIPRGVQDNTKIRFSEEGEAGVRGGKAGDLFVFVSVSKHKVFQRDGNNLICSMPISMVSASLGGEVEVVSLDKQKTALKIPAGVQTGERLRIKGKGMPVLRGSSFGDLLVDVVVETPVKLTKRQKELLQEFEDAGKLTENSPNSTSFFSKLKDFFERQ